MDWFLYDIGLRYERVKKVLRIIFRSNCSELFCKKGVLKNFAILLKKRLQQRCFPVNFAKFLFYRTPPVATSIFFYRGNRTEIEYKTLRRRPRRPRSALCTFNLGLASTRFRLMFHSHWNKVDSLKMQIKRLVSTVKIGLNELNIRKFSRSGRWLVHS